MLLNSNSLTKFSDSVRSSLRSASFVDWFLLFVDSFLVLFLHQLVHFSKNDVSQYPVFELFSLRFLTIPNNMHYTIIRQETIRILQFWIWGSLYGPHSQLRPSALFTLIETFSEMSQCLISKNFPTWDLLNQVWLCSSRITSIAPSGAPTELWGDKTLKSETDILSFNFEAQPVLIYDQVNLRAHFTTNDQLKISHFQLFWSYTSASFLKFFHPTYSENDIIVYKLWCDLDLEWRWII